MRALGTYEFQHVGDLAQHVIVEILQERHGLEELDVLLDALEAGAHHDLLEGSPIQHPNARVRLESFG